MAVDQSGEERGAAWESGRASWGMGDWLKVGEHVSLIKGGVLQPKGPQNGAPTLQAGQAMVNMVQEYARTSMHTHSI